MVKGLDTFREYFKGFEEWYVLIGGAACDILFASNEGQFRAPHDLDMVMGEKGVVAIVFVII